MDTVIRDLLDKEAIGETISRLFIGTDRRCDLLAEVRGDLATPFCYGIASHYLSHRSGRNTRTFVGSYDFSLVRIEGRWRISAFKFNLKYIDGNKDLESDSRD
ncbi:MAG TPA: hypothetical protein VK416_05040 [Thermoanaerobaculia bacterium]|nr:hypothetical protein [Thermoanaerobaculia bacterium]